MRARNPIQDRARQVSLLRLLLVAMALGVVIFAAESRQVSLAPESVAYSRWLLVAVGISAGMLAMLVSWTRHTWQLTLHLVFDLLWIGSLLYLTGGLASPIVPLLFAVVLEANLVLPGVFPLVIPSLASLVVATNAVLYLAHSTPFPKEFLEAYSALTDTNRILGYLAVQVGGLFTVDLLAQLLTRRLREQRAFTDELLDQLGEGVLAIDRTGTLAYVNDEAIRLLQLDANCRGKPIAQVLAAAHVQAVLTLALDTEPRLERLDTSADRNLVLRATNLLDRTARPLGRCVLIADETRLRILEENARRSDHLRSLGEMAAGIAHEVRNPLTSLRGCAQEIADICSRSSHQDAAALAGILVSESDRLARIVSDFLSLSRLRTPDRRPLDLEGPFEELRRLTSSRADLPPGFSLSIQIEDETPSVLADADQVRQVLLNLVTNAIDAVRGVGMPKVTCWAHPADDHNPLGMAAVVLEVNDNGCGMAIDIQERIFTPFFSTKAQGTGLGLSLVNRIVREHEGLLTVSSRPGTGTTIIIHLPAHSHTRTFRRALGHK